MFAQISKWAGFVKLSHTIFALPFALAAMIVAARETRGWPGWRSFLLILAAMVCARTCAMAFNRVVDRKFDALNPRTARRHLPAGEISLGSAVVLCVTSGAAFVASAWALNPLCFTLSPVALFFILFYSLTKRFTDFTHVWLGVALALAPLGAWLAVEGTLRFFPDLDGTTGLAAIRFGAFVPLTLAVAVVLWLIGFDIIYATQDYDFDRTHGLHSLVVRWGPRNALGVAFLAHLFMWALLVLFGILSAFRFAYWIGLMLILGLLVFEHFLARKRDPVAVNAAFFKLNASISIIFLVVVAVEVVMPWFRLRWY
ncbi:MAG TPA: UbiA-like polyprenyltransferase [Verrucomicrobiota bacterium]|nr:4-hydroxybenzoate octaprenyltransferase [Verrucomicrobiales bacterium]HRI16576.1 UbiA-like polyprenyltransferase [Verrucomicrobiota bacterium]